MNVKQRLIDALTPLGFPVLLQGTIPQGEAYPEAFITFWVTDTADGDHYDNAPAYWHWEVDVYFYATDPREVEAEPQRIREALKGAGFVPQGRGYDIPSDEPTHTGWAMEYYFREEA